MTPVISDGRMFGPLKYRASRGSTSTTVFWDCGCADEGGGRRIIAVYNPSHIRVAIACARSRLSWDDCWSVGVLESAIVGDS